MWIALNIHLSSLLLGLSDTQIQVLKICIYAYKCYILQAQLEKLS